MPSYVKPDKSLAKDQLQALQALLKAWGTDIFLQSMMWILVKNEHKIPGAPEVSRIIPFSLNPMQVNIESNLALWNIILKMRQGGATTYMALRRLLLPAVTQGGIGGLLISQSSKYAQEHFQIIRRAYNLFGAVNPAGSDDENVISIQLKQHLLHTQYASKHELFFDILDSRIRVESAEVEEAGQGITLHHILASEYARWPGVPEDTLSNVMGSLAPGGTLDIESTANGAGGAFFDACMRAIQSPDKSPAKIHYFSWWWEPGYRVELTRQEKRVVQASLDNVSDDNESEDERQHELLLIKKFHLDLEQIAWRRRTKLAQRANFDEKYPEDPITAFLTSGKQYFNRQILVARKMELVDLKPWKTFHSGQAQIFKQKIATRRYVIGADPATGRTVNNEDTDFCAAVVIDLETGEEQAAYHARVTPEDFAFDLADLGRYYNNATIAVERTGDGGTVILTLKGDCAYHAVYNHKEWFKRERKVVEVEGFPTTMKTRPIACNFLNRFIDDHPDLIHDSEFISEALVFVRNEKGKPEAMQGCHDDRVSARWIAYSARRALMGWWIPTENMEDRKYLDFDKLSPDEHDAVEV